MNPNPLTLLPARIRIVVYVAYGLASLVGGATLAYFAAIPTLTVPTWLTGILAALGTLAAPISVLAAGNVQKDGANGV